MRVVVLVKDVPNPAGTPPEIGPEFLLRREGPGGGLDPADEPGLELALRLVARDGGNVVAVSMGPEQAERACRRALAYGADRAVLAQDPALRGADGLVTARVLAHTIRTLDFDLVVAGVESADGATGAVPGALAELLELPAITFARHVEVSGALLRAERQTSAGYDVLECALPALVTVTAGAATARALSVRDTLNARKKPLDRLSLAELGLRPGDVHPTHHVSGVEIAPERQAGDVVDEAAGPERIVRLLDELEVLSA